VNGRCKHCALYVPGKGCIEVLRENKSYCEGCHPNGKCLFKPPRFVPREELYKRGSPW
jgi:hypothetical protein